MMLSRYTSSGPRLVDTAHAARLAQEPTPRGIDLLEPIHHVKHPTGREPLAAAMSGGSRFLILGTAKQPRKAVVELIGIEPMT